MEDQARGIRCNKLVYRSSKSRYIETFDTIYLVRYFFLKLQTYTPILECEAFQIFRPLLKRGQLGKKLVDKNGPMYQMASINHNPQDTLIKSVGMRSVADDLK